MRGWWALKLAPRITRNIDAMASNRPVQRVPDSSGLSGDVTNLDASGLLGRLATIDRGFDRYPLKGAVGYGAASGKLRCDHSCLFRFDGSNFEIPCDVGCEYIDTNAVGNQRSRGGCNDTLRWIVEWGSSRSCDTI